MDGAPDPKGESGTAGRAGIPLLCPSLFEPGLEMDDMVEVGIPLGTVMSEMLDGPAITELSVISVQAEPTADNLFAAYTTDEQSVYPRTRSNSFLETEKPR